MTFELRPEECSGARHLEETTSAKALRWEQAWYGQAAARRPILLGRVSKRETSKKEGRSQGGKLSEVNKAIVGF